MIFRYYPEIHFYAHFWNPDSLRVNFELKISNPWKPTTKWEEGNMINEFKNLKLEQLRKKCQLNLKDQDFQLSGKIRKSSFKKNSHRWSDIWAPNYLRLIKYPAKAALEKIQRNVKIIFAEVPRHRLYVTINEFLMQNVMKTGQGSYLWTPTLADGVFTVCLVVKFTWTRNKNFMKSSVSTFHTTRPATSNI